MEHTQKGTTILTVSGAYSSITDPPLRALRFVALTRIVPELQVVLIDVEKAEQSTVDGRNPA